MKNLGSKNNLKPRFYKGFSSFISKFFPTNHAVPKEVEVKKNYLSETSDGFYTPRDPRDRVDRPVNPKNSETFYFIQLSDWLAETGRNYYIQSKKRPISRVSEFFGFTSLSTLPRGSLGVSNPLEVSLGSFFFHFDPFGHGVWPYWPPNRF